MITTMARRSYNEITISAKSFKGKTLMGRVFDGARRSPSAQRRHLFAAISVGCALYRRSEIALAILLSIWIVVPYPAEAQARQPDDSSSADRARLTKPHVDDTSNDIIVTAPHNEPTVNPETELSEQDIAGYGTNTIGELLRRIAPLIDGSADQLVLLVNGKRIGSASGITGFPPEALNQLAILPPEAASRYGYSPNQRVVNLVLKRHFVSWSSNAGLTVPTAGGRNSEQLSAGRLVINGATYWNVQAQLSRDSALFKKDRAIPADKTLNLSGHILGLNGEEIDPSLSALANRSVFIAGIPPSALGGEPALYDFVATAGVVRFSDPNAFEALLPSTHSASFNAGLSRPFGTFSGSFNINVNKYDSEQHLGFPVASLILPADNPWSPFEHDVQVVPGFAGARPLRNDQSSTALGLSMALSGTVCDWQTNFSISYSRGWAANVIERGFNVGAVQTRIAAGDPSLNPYLPWQQSALQIYRMQSTSESLAGQINVGKAVMAIPTGPIYSNLSINLNHNRSASSLTDGPKSLSSQNDFQTNQLNLGLSISLPLSSQARAMLPLLGQLSIDLSGNVIAASGSRLQSQFTAGFNWSPFRSFRLNGSLSFAESAPTDAMLNAPRVESASRLYDYARQEIVDVVWISGGNPALSRGSQRSLSLRAMFRPFDNERLILTSAYRRQTAHGGVTSFPSPTPAVEKSFPERFARDPLGRLLAIDARPISLAQNLTERLDTSLVLLLSGGAKLPSRTGARRSLAEPVQVTFSINHGWQMKDQFLIRPGVPAFDQLNGGGGQPRHVLALQLVASTRGVGASLTGDWRNALNIRDTASSDGSGDFHYAPMTRFNLSLFAEPLRSKAGPTKPSLLSNLRISIDVQNLLNARQRIVLGNGSIPAGQSRDELDPLGRTIQLSVNTRW